MVKLCATRLNATNPNKLGRSCLRALQSAVQLLIFSILVLLLPTESVIARQLSPDRTNRDHGAATLPNEPMCKAWQSDATLRSIAAVSQDRLVAVGDRGTVLITLDAGRTWRLASVPTSVNLYDLKFVGDRGFAVGGWIGLETGSSYGAILYSQDGGESWQPMKVDLPRLTGLAIQGNRLICWGDYSTQLSSSVFVSLDYGVTWSSAVEGLGHASTAAISSTGQFAAIDQLGRAKFPASLSVQTLAHPDSSLNALIHLNNQWFAAGEFGEIISSRDGDNWSNVSLPLSDSVQRLCKWSCFESQAASVWLAGSPGSIVLRSNNFGQSWEVFPTGQKLPINKLCFIDQSRGWAVGSAGIILATRDGGQSWYPQRKQPERAALLTIAASPDFPSWIATATSVWDQKRVAAIISLERAEPIERAGVTPTRESRALDTARQLGAADYATLDLSRSSPDQAIQELAVQLAVWRPDIVLASFDQRSVPDQAQPIRSVSKAIRLAASPEFQETLQRLQLPSWQVSKLVSTTANGQVGYVEDCQRYILDLGVSVRDCLGCVSLVDRSKATQLSLQTTWSRVQSQTSQSELFGGVGLKGDTSLVSPFQPLGNYQMVIGRAHRDRALAPLISLDSANIPVETWASQLRFFLASVPTQEYSESAARAVLGLLQGQQWQRADQVLLDIAKRPDDVGLWAMDRYLKLAVSTEMRDWIGIPMPIQQSSENRNVVQTASYQDTWSNSPFDSKEQSAKGTVSNIGTQVDSNSSVIPASAEISSATARPKPISNLESNMTDIQFGKQDIAIRPRTARENLLLLDWAMKRHPSLSKNPQVQMMMATNLRETNNREGSRALLSELAEKSHIFGWSQAAQQELALMGGVEHKLKWQISARLTNQPPMLDGRLDETMWQDAQPMRLSSLNAQKDPLCEIRWSYDQEYLYVGISCAKANNQAAVAASKNRSRDADLRGLEQVELCLDLDRDYSSMIELVVAENGLTQDRCCGISSFDPKWYVDVNSTAQFWQAELAIRLDQLTSSLPNRETRWAVSARRVGASGLVQSWSQLLTHQKLPEANGLLIFE